MQTIEPKQTSTEISAFWPERKRDYR